MSKELLLMDDVEHLGAAGDVVNVSDGYARNFLVPKGLAAPVSDAMRRRLAKLQVTRVEQEKVAIADAQAMAGKLQNVSLTITARVIEDNRLYGSVSPSEVCKALNDEGFEIARSAIQMDEAIKETGTFDIRVLVRGEIDAAIKVTVVAE